MKVLGAIAWVGVGIVALGTPLAYSSSETMINWGLTAGFGFQLSLIMAISGTLLVLTGDFIAKPRYLWIAAVVVGFAYISAFYGGILLWGETLVGGLSLLFFLSPGLACIIGGIVMWRLSRRRSSEAI